MIVLFSEQGLRSFSGRRGTLLLMLFAALLCWIPTLSTQQTSSLDLPDAPGFGWQSSPAPAQPQATASISGTVVDPNGAVVQGAQATLSGPVPNATRTAQSDGNGQFTFSGLSAGTYRIRVTGPGMGLVRSPRINLAAGEVRYLPQMVLPIRAATTEVHVTADQLQIATQDVHVEESQRVLGIVPNFYSSYDWNAPPMNTKLKFHLASRTLIDPFTFVYAAGIAGGEQYRGMYPGFGSGWSGFGARYGAALLNMTDSRILGDAIFPSLFHQDPRYFYKGTGSTASRVRYAIEHAVICRGDNGHEQFAFSSVLGDFATGGLSNLYYPSGSRGASLTFENGFIEIGADAATNLLREFVLRGLTTHVPAHRAIHPGQ